MAEIVEVFEDIKEKVGDKWFYLLMGAGVLFGLYNLSKGSDSSGDTPVTVTSIASYPDSVTNADVIISTLQDSIEYTENQLRDEIQGIDNNIDVKFEATNDYINKGLESQNKLLQENFDDIKGSLDEVSKTTASTKKEVSKLTATATKGSSSKKTSSSSKTSYYTYKTKSGYNTATSIVDAIKVATGNYNAPDLKAIAKANGITNYSGTYSQNVQMLSMLKQGKLKKA